MYMNITILATIILLSINVVIVLPIYFYLRDEENNSIEKTLNTYGHQILNVTDENVANINHEIQRSKTIFSENGIFVSNFTFYDYLQFDNFAYKGNVESFFWIARVPYNMTDQFELFCSEHVTPNYTITEIDTITNAAIPVKPRDEYWPFVYFNPNLPSYKHLIGSDIGVTESGHYLLGMITDNLSASFRIQLAENLYTNLNSYGVVMGVDARYNGEIIGGMYSIVHVKSLFLQSFFARDLNNSDIDLFVFDVTEDGIANDISRNMSLLYKNRNPAYKNIWFVDDIEQNFSTKRYEYQFVNRSWVVYFAFTDSCIDQIRNNTYIIITVSISAILVLLDIICITFIHYIKLYKKQLENEITNKEFEKKKKDIANQTIAYVNHEVRNPLNVIKSLLELNLEQLMNFTGLMSEDDLVKMANSKDAKERNVNIPVTEMIPIISDYYTALGSCNLVEHIVNDVLDLQKLEENKLVLNEKNVIIMDFVMQFNKCIKQKLNEKPEIKYEVNVDEKIQTIRTDSMRLTQILLNYFTNSIKFTDEGKIELNIYYFDDDIRFEITDTGRGIKETDRTKVFKQFTQLDENDSTRHRGFGLGLYLCNMLGKRMNGSVGFDSKYGVGSKFWVQLKPNGSSDSDNVNIHIKSQQPLISDILLTPLTQKRFHKNNEDADIKTH